MKSMQYLKLDIQMCSMDSTHIFSVLFCSKTRDVNSMQGIHLFYYINILKVLACF